LKLPSQIWSCVQEIIQAPSLEQTSEVEGGDFKLL